MWLKHSVVHRGGLTATQWYGSTKTISATVSEKGIGFSFTLPSKGGGDTQIQLTVGSEDLQMLLKALAATTSGFTGTFAECTEVAVKHLIERSAGQGDG